MKNRTLGLHSSGYGRLTSCRSTITGDMIKNLKKMTDENAKKWQILHFLKNLFSIISLVILDLQECDIPQIKAKDIPFAPYFLTFLAVIIFYEIGTAELV